MLERTSFRVAVVAMLEFVGAGMAIAYPEARIIGFILIVAGLVPMVVWVTGVFVDHRKRRMLAPLLMIIAGVCLLVGGNIWYLRKLQNQNPNAAFVTGDLSAAQAAIQDRVGEVGGPADFEKWDKKDPLTLNQIAYLWYGREPVPTNRFGDFWTHEIQQIHREIDNRFFVLKAFEGQYSEPRGNGSDDQINWVPRKALIDWAIERGERPAFLFQDERGQ